MRFSLRCSVPGITSVKILRRYSNKNSDASYVDVRHCAPEYAHPFNTKPGTPRDQAVKSLTVSEGFHCFLATRSYALTSADGLARVLFHSRLPSEQHLRHPSAERKAAKASAQVGTMLVRARPLGVLSADADCLVVLEQRRERIAPPNRENPRRSAREGSLAPALDSEQKRAYHF
jgi:hypothetical protein